MWSRTNCLKMSAPIFLAGTPMLKPPANPLSRTAGKIEMHGIVDDSTAAS